MWLTRRRGAPFTGPLAFITLFAMIFLVQSLQIPNLIVQSGPPRTATTLQFRTLTIMGVLRLHESGMLHKFRSMFGKGLADISSCCDNTTFTFVKTHNEVMNIPRGSWLFITTRNGRPDEKRQKMLDHYEAGIFQQSCDISEAIREQYFVARKYQPTFGLSDDEMSAVYQYLRYWDILRLCCGAQMATEYRNILLGKSNQTHECQAYNIDKITEMLFKTSIAQMILKHPHLAELLAPSNRDIPFFHSYCGRYNQAVVEDRLTFNKRITQRTNETL